MTDQEEVNEWIAKGESSRIAEEGRWVKRVQVLAR